LTPLASREASLAHHSWNWLSVAGPKLGRIIGNTFVPTNNIKVQLRTFKGNFLYPTAFSCAIDLVPNGTKELEVVRKAKETPHLRLRVEPALLTRLEKSAEKNGRTLTGEIVDRLDASFKRDDMQAYVDATAQSIAEKLLAASNPDSASTKHASQKIWEGKLFEMDLKVLQEKFPGTPVGEIARYLQEGAVRRAKREEEQ
jgi:hypothetical protein